MKKNSSQLSRAAEILESAKTRPLLLSERKELAVELAALMIHEANSLRTKEELRSHRQLSKMMEEPKGKAFVVSMTDQCFRSDNPYRIADQLLFLLKKYGIPQFTSFFTKLGLKTFTFLGKSSAPLFTRMVKYFLRKETKRVIVPGEPNKLFKYIKRRTAEGIRVNLNHLGEAILGEEEANNRLNIYLNDLTRPEIEYISIKISTLSSQLNLLAWNGTIEKLGQKIRELYRYSMRYPFKGADGEMRPKFVNLDMEEYRDLHLTVDLFKKILDEPEFKNYTAGIVLQAYLPDSFSIQEELTEWAKKRISEGGAPIKIRLVKGANLAMEQVQASLEGWPQAPFTEKSEVDANYKKMVHYGLRKGNAPCAHIGIASHNLFDIAYALILRSEQGVESFVTFEMLEGMVDHQRKVVQAVAKGILLYCPTAKKTEFVNAVAYLIRRFDENTSPENYLRHVFDLAPGSPYWDEQVKRFEKACDDMESVSSKPRRVQNRKVSTQKMVNESPFENEPNTDWSLANNRFWIEHYVKLWKNKSGMEVPLMIGSEEVWNEERQAAGIDPSRPKLELYRYTLATEEQANQAVAAAHSFSREWRKVDAKKRSIILGQIANKLRTHRGDLIGCMIADAGKTIEEADAEVSEAIDFCEYYRRNMEELLSQKDIEWTPKGVVLVTPPWNFPCAIPMGGIAAALAAGNTVILKPAEEAVLVAWHLVKFCWDAGVPKKALQFVVCKDEPVGTQLILDKRIDSVILTGSTATAKFFCRERPGLDLHAETGGKNAIIVTNLSDRDLAIKEIIQSAFSHSGQKCSACSLLILESEVYASKQFQKQLRDAAASLKVGPSWDPDTKINPLIHPPEGELLHALTTLEEGEEWLLAPSPHPDNPRLWSPGIKWGVKPGSLMHRTELFGPLLGVICAKNLQEALAIANDTPYGLTSGLHSLDEREQEHWLKHIEAGNCYINRGITGAIVQRQPFGGCKASSYGAGAKAGGPNYVMQLMHAAEKGVPQEGDPVNDDVAHLCSNIAQSNERWNRALSNYAFYWNRFYSIAEDPLKLLGQENLLKYRPRKGVVLRVQEEEELENALFVIAAVLTCHCTLQISATAKLLGQLKELASLHQFSAIQLLPHTENEFIGFLNKSPHARVRMFSPPSQDLLKCFAEQAIYHYAGPALANGRIELCHYLQEVSISKNYHRYGNFSE